MTIKEITKYKFNGKEYNNLKDVKTTVENILGEKVIDEIINVCPPAKVKDTLNILTVLTDPKIREVLIKYLNITYEDKVHSYDYSPLHGDTETKNILDL